MSEKSAILGDIELSSKGSMAWGDSTNYFGPTNPSSVTTLVDGTSYGQDNLRGKLYGDWWDLTGFQQMSPKDGLLYIKLL